MTRSDPVLVVDSVAKAFKRTSVLHDVSFSVLEAGITAILGPSGCGKTTLLRLIAGFERVDQGSIALNGAVVESTAIHLNPEARHLGMVPQEGALFPHLTVEKNIAYGLKRNAPPARVDEMLRLIEMSELRDRRPAQLSGGQQQRVALARALAPAPKMILLDEPFTALDAAMRSGIRDEVASIIRRTGSTALIVTHDQEEAMSIADQVVVLLDGRVAQSGDPHAIYEAPVSLAVAKFVGEANTVSARVVSGIAHHALGTTPCRLPDGPAIVMVRPEQIALTSADDGCAGVVETRSYFGHDGTLGIRCESNDLISIRVPITQFAPLGSRLHIKATAGTIAFSC